MRNMGYRLTTDVAKVYLDEDGALLSLLDTHGLLSCRTSEDITTFKRLRSGFRNCGNRITARVPLRRPSDRSGSI